MWPHFAFESRRHGKMICQMAFGEKFGGSYRNDLFLPVEELISLELGKTKNLLGVL